MARPAVRFGLEPGGQAPQRWLGFRGVVPGLHAEFRGIFGGGDWMGILEMRGEEREEGLFVFSRSDGLSRDCLGGWDEARGG